MLDHSSWKKAIKNIREKNTEKTEKQTESVL